MKNRLFGRARPGLTHAEVLMVVVVLIAIAAPLSVVAVRGVSARATTEEDIFTQQDMAQALTTFSFDVRSASGLLNATGDRFTLRHYKNGAQVFTSYRLLDGRLQRGQSTSADTEPAAWRDIMDSARFRIARGAFSYFAWGNRSESSSRLFRRIEIKDLQVKSARSGAAVDSPPISAVMREGANARGLQLVAAPAWRAHKEASHADVSDGTPYDPKNGSSEDAVFILFDAVNTTREPMKIAAFNGAWTRSDNHIEAFTLDAGSSVTWGNGRDQLASGASPVRLDEAVEIPVGGKASFKVFLKMASRMESFALKLYDADDTQRRDPYVIELMSPPAPQTASSGI